MYLVKIKTKAYFKINTIKNLLDKNKQEKIFENCIHDTQRKYFFKYFIVIKCYAIN